MLFLCFWPDNRPTRAGAALRAAAPSERGWAITKKNESHIHIRNKVVSNLAKPTKNTEL